MRFTEIGQQLRAYRLESGLRAEEIAARLGVSRAALYRYEKGEVIKLDTIQRLAANPMLGTHLEELGAFGYGNYRKTLVRQTRVVYEFDNEQLIIHLFIHTKRDFRAHLEKRLFAPA